ncbi:diguanylate cyclase [Yoonia sp.]|uniref:diguanylate cyclase n=1 Tax=Yoonia sp. TaxID=2212373 RepID=UPI002FD8ED74
MAQLQLLLSPILAVFGIAFVFNLVLHGYGRSRYRDVAFGGMFGMALVIGMTNPLYLDEGLIFDPRSVLIATATVFAGPVAGVTALGIGLVCRVIIGGAGVYAGLAGLVAAYLLALAYMRWLRPRFQSTMVADAALGLAVTPALLAIFLLPFDVALDLLPVVAPVLTISNVVGAVVLGLLFRREIALQDHRLELETHAIRDPLTNLLNRRGLQAQADRRRFNPRVGQAMLYFDVDNFKQINDSHGHDIGDTVLEVIAKRITESLRPGAIFARHGGDEFSVYLTEVTEGDLGGIAERLCLQVNQRPLSIADLQVRTSISMGGFWSKECYSLDELIRRADAQLLMAKRAGKNCLHLAYDPKSTLVSAA